MGLGVLVGASLWFLPSQYGVDLSRMLGHGITCHCMEFCFYLPECKVKQVGDTMATCDLKTETSFDISLFVCSIQVISN